LIFKAGADSVMTGNYLVTTGRTFDDDLEMLIEEGLTIRTY
jgi:biotin synthase-like enzyme